MENKTAVEWLQIELDSILDLNPSEFGKVQQRFEQSKEMEKEQLEKAIEFGNEKMYSDEDMQEYAEFCIRCNQKGFPCIIAKDWFEQFKKK